MKNKKLTLRISERRLNKLREYAASRDKTMTSLLEDWIDSLPQKTLPTIHEGLCGSPASAPGAPRLNTDSTNTV